MPAKYWGRGSIGLDATPTVLILICHPVDGQNYTCRTVVLLYLPCTQSKVKVLEKKRLTVILNLRHFKATFLGKFQKEYKEPSVIDVEILEKGPNFLQNIFDFIFSTTPSPVIS